MKTKGGEKQMKRMVFLLTVLALITAALAGTASAQSYDYCWDYSYWYGWYWYYC
jgi:hypothetical protein